MSGNGFVEGWCINLCSLQPAIMVKVDVPKPLWDGNWEFRVPLRWSSGRRFNHLMDSSLDWLMHICSWRALKVQTVLRRSLWKTLWRAAIWRFSSSSSFCLCLVFHWCALMHFWCFGSFIGMRFCTSDNGQLWSMVVFGCNFHRSQDHCGCSFFESQNWD
jgi:hypothetical protein